MYVWKKIIAKFRRHCISVRGLVNSYGLYARAVQHTTNPGQVYASQAVNLYSVRKWFALETYVQVIRYFKFKQEWKFKLVSNINRKFI